MAAFARANLGRLLFVQFTVALLAGVSAAWFLNDACFPTVLDAIRQMPEAGDIRSGSLDWHGDSPQLLAEGRFLAVDVDKNHSGQIRSPAELQVEFGTDSIRVFSTFGYYSDFPYPPRGILPFNRQELEPLWDAWAAEILFMAVAVVTVALVLNWWLLATLYFLPACLLGFFMNRDLSLWAGWKLSGASLMPGALVMVAGIMLYGLGLLNLVSFSLLFAMHFVLGWAYVAVSPLFLSRISDGPPKGNPFRTK